MASEAEKEAREEGQREALAFFFIIAAFEQGGLSPAYPDFKPQGFAREYRLA